MLSAYDPLIPVYYYELTSSSTLDSRIYTSQMVHLCFPTVRFLTVGPFNILACLYEDKDLNRSLFSPGQASELGCETHIQHVIFDIRAFFQRKAYPKITLESRIAFN